jgi:hypothetical protein
LILRRESPATNTLVNVNRQQGSARSGDLSLGHIGPGEASETVAISRIYRVTRRDFFDGNDAPEG